MNDINRAVVKQQAKDLIRGKVFQLFIIIFIVGLLTGSGSGFGLNFNFKLNNNNFNFGELFGRHSYTEDYGHNYGYNYNYGYDYDDDEYDYDGDADDDFDFDQFYENQQNGVENPIEDFEDIVPDSSFDNSYNDDFLEDVIGGSFARSLLFIGLPIFALLAVISVIMSLIFSPLQVTLSGLLVSFVRRNPAEKYDLGKEFSSLFKNTFNKYFWKKLGLMLLRNLIIFLLSLLFIIPGIVYYYSTYFANQLMCDNPDLSPSEALELSKRMTKGHRVELFALGLSFFPWLLLILVTFGIASVYVSPYVQVTDALFYENFRLRALQNGVISQQEITSREAVNNQANENYFSGNPYGSAHSDPYSNGYNSQSYNAQGYNSQSYGENYYSSQQDNNSTQTGGYYQPPADNNYNQEN